MDHFFSRCCQASGIGDPRRSFRGNSPFLHWSREPFPKILIPVVGYSTYRLSIPTSAAKRGFDAIMQLGKTSGGDQLRHHGAPASKTMGAGPRGPSSSTSNIDA